MCLSGWVIRPVLFAQPQDPQLDKLKVLQKQKAPFPQRKVWGRGCPFLWEDAARVQGLASRHFHPYAFLGRQPAAGARTVGPLTAALISRLWVWSSAWTVFPAPPIPARKLLLIPSGTTPGSLWTLLACLLCLLTLARLPSVLTAPWEQEVLPVGFASPPTQAGPTGAPLTRVWVWGGQPLGHGPCTCHLCLHELLSWLKMSFVKCFCEHKVQYSFTLMHIYHSMLYENRKVICNQIASQMWTSL